MKKYLKKKSTYVIATIVAAILFIVGICAGSPILIAIGVLAVIFCWAVYLDTFHKKDIVSTPTPAARSNNTNIKKLCPRCHARYMTGSDSCPSCGYSEKEREDILKGEDALPETGTLSKKDEQLSTIEKSLYRIERSIEQTNTYLKFFYTLAILAITCAVITGIIFGAQLCGVY